MMFVSSESVVPRNGETCDRLTTSATAGQCITSQSDSAIIGQGRLGTVPISLTLVPDCLYGL